MDLLRSSNINDLFSNTITQLYADASFAGSSGSDVFFTFAWPMNPLQESDYMNAWSPVNTSGSMLVVENISALVDSIPALGQYYTPSGNNVSDVYEYIVTSYTFNPSAKQVQREGATAALTPDISTLDTSALGIEIVTANSPVGEVTVASTTPEDLQAMDAERQQANEVARQRAMKIMQSGSSPAPAALKVQALKSAPARPVPFREASNSLSSIFSKANAIYQNTRLASIRYPQLDFHASEIQPSNFADAGAASNWPSIELKWPVTLNGIVEQVNVSFKFCRVDIIRPWMITYLLSVEGWGIQSQRKGWLSTGTPQNNNGIFPLLPVSLILCRDLVIKSDSGSLNYNVAGLQILAYINKLLPFMPTLG
jgi:hypothetical protein